MSSFAPELASAVGCNTRIAFFNLSFIASAGIPDFRSPKTGLYHNLKKLNLDYPEQVFDIDFFRRRPEPFYELAHELYPGKFTPTLTHTFIRLLDEKGLLLRCFTQNIDTLERRAGVKPDRLVEAHGSFAANHCISPRCGLEADPETTKETILKKEIPRCKKCKSLVKPDIVFFGEGLPEVFFERLGDLHKADLLIVLGTSLQVQPFASLPNKVSKDCPRILINLEDVGNFSRSMDIVKLMTCDNGCKELAEACGWAADLQQLHKRVQRESSDGAANDKSAESSADDEDKSRELDTAEEASLETSEDVVLIIKGLQGTNL